MIGLFRYPVFAEDPAPRANKVLSLLFIAGTAVLIADALFLAPKRCNTGLVHTENVPFSKCEQFAGSFSCNATSVNYPASQGGRPIPFESAAQCKIAAESQGGRSQTMYTTCVGIMKVDLCLGPFSALGAAFGYVSVLMGLAASTYNYLARKEIERLKVSAPVTPAPDGQQSLPPVGMKNVERALGEEAKATV